MSTQFNNGKRWRASLREFRSPRAVAFCGVMCALSIVLGTFATINLGPYLKIGLSGLPNQVVDYLFGPVAGAIFSGALEVLKEDLKKLNADVTVEQETYDMVTAIKPLFLVHEYR